MKGNPGIRKTMQQTGTKKEPPEGDPTWGNSGRESQISSSSWEYEERQRRKELVHQERGNTFEENSLGKVPSLPSSGRIDEGVGRERSCPQVPLNKGNTS